jgi:FkbH-like protein
MTRDDMPADPSAMVEAGLLLADAVPDGRPLRVAIAATFTAESVAPLLRVLLVAAGIAPQLHVCPFDQVQVQLANPDSELARFRPDVTLVLVHDHALLPADWDPTRLDKVAELLRQRVDILGQGVRGFVERTSGTVLLHTVPLSRVEQRTVISFRGRAALGRVWREVNTALLELAEQSRSVHVLDLEALLADHTGPLRDPRLYGFASMAWTLGVELLYAREAATFCRAVVGLSRKVLALDGDNTLWGGVVGDDGTDSVQLGSLYPGNAYVDLQWRGRALRRQGVLLVLASKNEADTVDRLLDEHPAMVLRAADFVARAVDWHPKDDNLRRVAESLGLAIESFVFADDSRFECDLVRHALPSVAVAHLAGDPTGHAAAVLDPDHFAVLDATATDHERTDLYRARLDRRQSAAAFTSAADYLHSLGLRVVVREADTYTVPRLVQLSLRTNQFTMVRGAHSESDTWTFADSPDHLLLAVEVADRFGADGVVGGIWLTRHPDHWLIENFVLSCRVFSRGVEHAALHSVVTRALEADVPRIDARLVRTERNAPAAAFYPSTGFAQVGPDRFTLPLDPSPLLLPPWIELEQEPADV